MSPPAAIAADAGGDVAGVRLGMPHLDLHGLSELFALAEAGDRHWRALARRLGRPPSQWRGPNGERAYASIVYSRIDYAGPIRGGEDDETTIATEILGADPPFFASRTRFAIDGAPICAVTLLTATVIRAGAGNTRFLRADLGERPAAPIEKRACATLRDQRKQVAADTPSDAMRIHRAHTVRPMTDFNNAGFIYFVTFSRLFREMDDQDAPLRRRAISYWGNADAGDALTLGRRGRGDGVADARIERAGAPLACASTIQAAAIAGARAAA